MFTGTMFCRNLNSKIYNAVTIVVFQICIKCKNNADMEDIRSHILVTVQLQY